MNDELNELINTCPIQFNRSEDYIKENHPDYYNQVVEFICKLGSNTCIHGHNELFDQYKNQAYKLIGL